MQTFKEAGIGDFPGHVWWGLVGPKGIRRRVVETLNREFVALRRDPQKSVAFLEKQAVLPAAGSVAEFVDFLKH